MKTHVKHYQEKLIELHREERDMTREEWSKYLIDNGVVRAKNVKANKYIVEFKDTFYIIKNDEVIDTAFYLATAKRKYK